MDFLKRFLRLEEQVDRLWRASKNHTETKTFLVPGDISTSRVVPPFNVALDEELFVAESKQIIGVRGLLLSGGSVTVWWVLNEATTAIPPHVVTTTPGANDITLTDPIELEDGDWIRPVIASTSGTPADMAVTVVMRARVT